MMLNVCVSNQRAAAADWIFVDWMVDPPCVGARHLRSSGTFVCGTVGCGVRVSVN